jgi:outer membrane scaffolding protein for murein synthesis (MipA/OmpV family)
MIARLSRLAPLATLALGLAFAAPAAAQDDEPPILPGPEVLPDVSVFDGDYVIIGAGGMSTPTYDGSDKSRFQPAVAATGEIGGIGFTVRGPSLSLDLSRDKPRAKSGLRFGPQIRLRSNRHSKIGDPVVARLGRLDNVIEAGFRVGASFDNLLSKADGLSVGVSARWDISGKGSGMVITPSATYLIPVSKAQAFGVLVSAQFGDGKYADYNYAITPQGSAASGLPVFDAKGGLQDVSLGVATARDLNGNFLDGGFAIGAGVLYSRLYGSAARTPITSIRGDRDQWTFGGGLSYTF